MRTTKQVERDLKRTRKAQRRLRRDWDAVMLSIARKGGVIGLTGRDRAGDGLPGEEKHKLNGSLRQQRELQKA